MKQSATEDSQVAGGNYSIRGLILGAGGEPGATQSSPAPRSLLEDPFGGRVLDWILTSYKRAHIEDITFVGGYRIEEIGHSYPALNFIYNPDWNDGGVLSSLYHARATIEGGILISYGDVVYREHVCQQLIEKVSQGMAVAVDMSFHHTDESEGEIRKNLAIIREGRLEDIGFLAVSGKVNAEFVGLVYLAPDVTPFIREFLEEQYPALIGKPFEQAHDIRLAYMTDLIRHVQRSGLDVQAVDIGSNWAEMDEPDSLAHFVLGTKSETLDRLAGVITKGRFCDQLVCRVGEWKAQRDRLIQTIQSRFAPHPIVVRSSALAEDSWQDSMAGAFQSVLNVDSRNAIDIANAMDTVLASYQKTGEIISDDNQILMQRMVRDVVMHGVVFTRDIQHNAPYYVVNYDDESDQTDTVTSGGGVGLKTVIVSRANDDPLPSPRLTALLDVVRELESVTGCTVLDIEFAIDVREDIYVLQVRPLTVVQSVDRARDQEVAVQIRNMRAFFSALAQPVPHLFGKTTLLGDMPDWNPAEMIGPRPRPLALSLYQYLITDEAWREARGLIGYHNPTASRLMMSLAEHPYIDVRASFNNLIPKNLPAPLAEKIINIYLDRLREHPDRHDKIEFEVCVTCLDFDFDSHAKKLLQDGLEEQEVEIFRKTLWEMTDSIVRERHYPMSALLQQLEKLAARREQFLASSMAADDIPRLIDCLLNDCIADGIIPFSILARYAFIANSFLKSLVARGILTVEEMEQFLNQIDSVATELVHDLDAVSSRKLPLKAFLSKYGHLRPGTYDITSLRYDEAPETYFSLDKPVHPLVEDGPSEKPEWNPDVLRKIQLSIREAGFTFTVETLFDFCCRAISLREQGKFEFTKSLSQVLKLIGVLGEREGLSREDLSYLDIQDLLKMGVNRSSVGIGDQLRESIARGRNRCTRSGRINLPHFIRNPGDFSVMELQIGRPNFVTAKKVKGNVLEISSSSQNHDLRGQIVLIESADPGYDWIFSYEIAGLITQYGGAASHMTIRASEFNVPAAIGCGEVLYQRLRKAQFIELDCMGKHVRAL